MHFFSLLGSFWNKGNPGLFMFEPVNVLELKKLSSGSMNFLIESFEK